ncbi:uncharacterized protein PV06_11847 [Exophiala oligosperma]|uniref:Uncharacterized protein n=2 Tax=Chaetothyriales TaxID=34395 RepID=A0A0D2BE97_9EURO|nr:uncharacterized protein PV06_11847 [Exophiala oligosperma]KAJ9608567.1 hypothetical protein H2204_015684 [Knufia peltigerae]KIW35827.1 hypothetical protein PV06_11847 [Exophiala oligosperma]
MAPPTTIREACDIILEQLQDFNDTDKINDLRSAITDFIEAQTTMQTVSIRVLALGQREDPQMQPIVERTNEEKYKQTLRSLSGAKKELFKAVNYRALLETMMRCLDDKDLEKLRSTAAKQLRVLMIEHGYV